MTSRSEPSSEPTVTPTTTFAGVTAITASGPNQFEAVIDPAWTIGGNPNGGYLLGMLGRAAVEGRPHPHVIAASAHYLRPPQPGPAQLDVELLRGGRSASQLRARLSQNDAVCVESLITTSELQLGTTPFWDAGVPASPTAAWEDCYRVPGQSPAGTRVAIMEQVDLRLDPATTGFAVGKPSGTGELRGWLALPADEQFDPLSLIYAVDAFPPATFEIEMTGWVPTLELSVYVRALPAPGPVRILHRATLIEAQRVDEVAYIWDSTGRLVAQGTQLAAIKLG